VLTHTGCPENDLFSSDIIHAAPGLDIWYNFQLLPEMAETIAEYDQAIFIDAHTGEIQEDISFKPIKPEFQNSPFTHHFTPASCLAVAESIKGRYPKAFLLSVRGYQFAFNRDLSKETLTLVEKAFELIKKDYLE
jgi:Ni,Fe-hydrogenase maturation factor